VVAVDREDGYGDVEVWIFIVDRWKAKGVSATTRGEQQGNPPEPSRLALFRVTQELNLDRFITESVFTEKSECLVETVSGWFVLVEEVSSQEDEVYL
jgi:hypothetical protein